MIRVLLLPLLDVVQFVLVLVAAICVDDLTAALATLVVAAVGLLL